MRTGHTFTRHFDLETRQHELLGMDLGEGAPRRALVLGITLCGLWAGTLLLLFGLPSRYTFTLYLLPPLITTVYGTQRAREMDRRWNITRWSIAVRYLALGHRPVICGGRRAAGRSEWISRRDRWAGRADALLSSPLRPLVRRWLGEGVAPVTSGTPIRLQARPRLHGPDSVVRAYGRAAVSRRQKAGEGRGTGKGNKDRKDTQ